MLLNKERMEVISPSNDVKTFLQYSLYVRRWCGKWCHNIQTSILNFSRSSAPTLFFILFHLFIDTCEDGQFQSEKWLNIFGFIEHLSMCGLFLSIGCRINYTQDQFELSLSKMIFTLNFQNRHRSLPFQLNLFKNGCESSNSIGASWGCHGCRYNFSGNWLLGRRST